MFEDKSTAAGWMRSKIRGVIFKPQRPAKEALFHFIALGEHLFCLIAAEKVREKVSAVGAGGGITC
jgi:hypothetical protein